MHIKKIICVCWQNDIYCMTLLWFFFQLFCHPVTENIINEY